MARHIKNIRKTLYEGFKNDAFEQGMDPDEAEKWASDKAEEALAEQEEDYGDYIMEQRRDYLDG